MGPEYDDSVEQETFAIDPAAPGGIWDPDVGTVSGGINYEFAAGGERR